MDQHEHLGKEWQTLQDNHEQYEKMALAIKVLATTLCFITFALPIDVLLSCAILMALWIQEATVRTSQARLGVRLLQVEALLQQPARLSGGATGAGDAAYGLHTHWVATRPGTLGLLSEYLANAQRPTVAFPYIVLLLLLVGEWWILPG